MAGTSAIGPLTLLGIYTSDDRQPQVRLQEAAARLREGELPPIRGEDNVSAREIKVDAAHTTATLRELGGIPVGDLRDGAGRLLGWVRHASLGAGSGVDAGTSPLKPSELEQLDEASRKAIASARGLYLVGIVPGGADPYSTVTRALRLGAALWRSVEGLIVDVVACRVLSSVHLSDLAMRSDAQIDGHVSVDVRAAKKGGGLWIHTHGMEKFAAPNLEAFDVDADSVAAVSELLVLLGDELVLGEGPDLDGTLDIQGGVIRLRPAEAVRGIGSRRSTCPHASHTPSLVVVDEEGGGPINQIARAHAEAPDDPQPV